MLYIGPHTSIAGGYAKAGKAAFDVGANTFQFFTRNPRGGNAKALNEKDIARLTDFLEEKEFGPLLAHAPYTLNLCSNKEETRTFAESAFKEDLKRLEKLPCSLYNFHPGSHVGQGVQKGIEWIVAALNRCISQTQTVTVLLETMSGKGSEVGSSFEELAEIIQGVDADEKIGICMDTCHIYSAGYNIREDLDGVLENFDKVIGLDRLRAIHLNDSMTPMQSHKDRHEKLGFGTIGMDTFIRIVTHPALKEIPMFLETPQTCYEDYAREITLLRENAEK